MSPRHPPRRLRSYRAEAAGVGPAKAGHYSGGDVASGFSRTRALVMELVEGEDLSQPTLHGCMR